MANSTHLTAPCARCKLTKPIRARFLCRACYRQVCEDGTVNDWPGMRGASLPVDIGKRGRWVKQRGIRRWIPNEKNTSSPVPVAPGAGRG